MLSICFKADIIFTQLYILDNNIMGNCTLNSLSEPYM